MFIVLTITATVALSAALGAWASLIYLTNTLNKVEREANKKLDRAFELGMQEAVARIANAIDPYQLTEEELTAMIADD